MARRPQRPVASAMAVSDLPTDLDPRAKAEIMVLGQIRDTLLNLDSSVRDVRERVIRIEATNTEAKLLELKETLEKKDIERDKVRDAMALKLSQLELQQARWQGTFMPLVVLATGVGAAVITFVMNALLGTK